MSNSEFERIYNLKMTLLSMNLTIWVYKRFINTEGVVKSRHKYIEDMWKTISDMVYDGPQYLTTSDLHKKIVQVISVINSTKRDPILYLTSGNYLNHLKWNSCKVVTM